MIKAFVDWLFYTVLGLNVSSRAIESLNFFVYDSIKILFLMFFMIWLVGFLRTYISPDKVKQWIVRKKSLGNIAASCFGTITPFCSCSSIPIFLSFLEAGVPLGVCFSFLITSPLVNEYLAILMLGFFGWKITLIYISSGIVIGVVTGMILGKMDLEKYIIKQLESTCCDKGNTKVYAKLKDRVNFGLKEAETIVRKIWFFILIGVGFGALIHNYVPEASVRSIVGRAGIFSVPIATLLGVPMYGNGSAVVPVAVALFRKGLPLGTVLSFMMAIVGLSFPEAIILKRALKFKLIIIFFGVTAIAIIFTGYFFNFLEKLI